jgi:hypothetical protein
MTQAKIKEKGNDTQLLRGMYEQCYQPGKINESGLKILQFSVRVVALQEI